MNTQTQTQHRVIVSFNGSTLDFKQVLIMLIRQLITAVVFLFLLVGCRDYSEYEPHTKLRDDGLEIEEVDEPHTKLRDDGLEIEEVDEPHTKLRDDGLEIEEIDEVIDIDAIPTTTIATPTTSAARLTTKGS